MNILFERTIAAAYRFAFTSILSLVGIAWFPYLLLVAIVGGAIFLLGPQFMNFLDSVQPHKQPDPAQMRVLLRVIGTAYLVLLPASLLVTAMVKVGVLRKALGQHPGPMLIFFSLGRQVWRLVGGYILLFLLFYGAALVFAAAGAGIWFALDKSQPSLATPVVVVLGIAAALFCIYAFVRTYFFLPAIVVAENRIGLLRSWHLGYGNFWRIVGIVLVIFLPLSFAVSIISSTVMQVAMGPTLGQHLGAQAPADPHEVAKMLLALFLKIGPYFAVVQIAQAILLEGLQGGAIASAYRSVTGTGEASASLQAAS